jgi:exodeoxyribonuclease-5
MQWGREQDAALSAVSDWMNSDAQLFRLFGYAGTGKTTLARHFAEGIEGSVLFAAYTGKAAHVLKTKGCVGATTIHSLIYHSKDRGRAELKALELQLAETMMELKAEGATDDEVSRHPAIQRLQKLLHDERTSSARPMFTLNRESVVRDAALVVIDECSMVDGQMGADLLSFGRKVLVLGDPAQLPPVGGAGFFTEGVKPEVMLTDIHRQAADNPIIGMATRVRNGDTLELGSYGSSTVIDRKDIRQDDVMNAGQVLVGRNATRRASNMRLRSLLGFDAPVPMPDDKLVCLRNNNENGLLNGAIWRIDDIGHQDEHRIHMTVRPEEGGVPLECEGHMAHFLGDGAKLPWYEKKEAEEFDYGYALTVHKSQGSQWDNVVLFDESWVFRQDRHRWLYTGITRAAEKLTLVRM